jgi:hypothetical protein
VVPLHGEVEIAVFAAHQDRGSPTTPVPSARRIRGRAGVAAVRFDRAQDVLGGESRAVQDAQPPARSGRSVRAAAEGDEASAGAHARHRSATDRYPGAPVATDHSPSTARDRRHGVRARGVRIWGLARLLEAARAIPAAELTAWRALCSAAFGVALLCSRAARTSSRALLRDARGALPIALSAALLGVNWLVFIYAVQIDASPTRASATT